MIEGRAADIAAAMGLHHAAEAAEAEAAAMRAEAETAAIRAETAAIRAETAQIRASQGRGAPPPPPGPVPPDAAYAAQRAVRRARLLHLRRRVRALALQVQAEVARRLAWGRADLADVDWEDDLELAIR